MAISKNKKSKKLNIRQHATAGQGFFNPETNEYKTTPWGMRFNPYNEHANDFGNVFSSLDGSQVWAYFEIPTESIQALDMTDQITRLNKLQDVLNALGGSHNGLSRENKHREVHLVSHAWEDDYVPNPSWHPQHKQFLNEVVDSTTPQRILFLGIRLRPDEFSDFFESARAFLKGVDAKSKKASRDLADTFNGYNIYEEYKRDFSNIMSTLRPFFNTHVVPPTKTSLAKWDRMTYWFNEQHQHMREFVEWGSDFFRFTSSPEERMYKATVVKGLNRGDLQSPTAQYLKYVSYSELDAPEVMSLRMELRPSTVAAADLSKKSRKEWQRIHENEKAGGAKVTESDSERKMDQESMTKLFNNPQFDAVIAHKISLVLISRHYSDELVDAAAQHGHSLGSSFMDDLQLASMCRFEPARGSQFEAAMETLPCSTVRSGGNQWTGLMASVAHAGMQSVTAAGDTSHVKLKDDADIYMGTTLDTGAPVMVSSYAPNDMNKPASTIIIGDTGAGKTYKMQSMVVQQITNGHTVVVIDPKLDSDLEGLGNAAEAFGRKYSKLTLGAGSSKSDNAIFDPFVAYSMDGITMDTEDMEMEELNILTKRVDKGVDWLLTGIDMLDIKDAVFVTKSGLTAAHHSGAATLGQAIDYIGLGLDFENMPAERAAELVALGKEIKDKVIQTRRFNALFDSLIADPEDLVEDSGIVGEGELIYITFGSSLQLPDPTIDRDSWSPTEALSAAALAAAGAAAQNMLMKEDENGNAVGGILHIDEAGIYMRTERADIQAKQRLYRSKRIALFMYSQHAKDFIDPESGIDMASFCERFFFLRQPGTGLLDGSSARIVGDMIGIRDKVHLEKLENNTNFHVLFRNWDGEISWIRSMTNLPSDWAAAFDTSTGSASNSDREISSGEPTNALPAGPATHAYETIDLDQEVASVNPEELNLQITPVEVGESDEEIAVSAEPASTPSAKETDQTEDEELDFWNMNFKADSDE